MLIGRAAEEPPAVEDEIENREALAVDDGPGELSETFEAEYIELRFITA